MVRNIMKHILKKNKKYYEAHKQEAREHNKQNRDKNADRLKEYGRAGNQIKIYCPHCNGEIVKRKLNSHLQSQKCKKKLRQMMIIFLLVGEPI